MRGVSCLIPKSGEDGLNIFVFNDQAHTTIRVTKGILKASKSSPLLKRVVHHCSSALREASSYNCEHAFYSIEHIVRLAESTRNHDAVLWTVLSCFSQLGCLALLWERHPALFCTRVSSIGLCTGAIAAVASLFISSDDDTCSIARELIAISYRMGVEAESRSRNISWKVGSWSVAIKDVSEETVKSALSSFNESNKLPIHLHAYISALFPQCVTISGPPDTLDYLLEQQDLPFASAQKKRLPIYAAFHAGHLLCPNVEQILGDARLDNFSRRPGASMVFPGIAELDSSAKLSTFLRHVITDSFQSKLNIQDAPSPIHSIEDIKKYGIISIAANIGMVQRWIDRSNTIRCIAFFPEIEEKKSVGTAIIGYSGRFPGADTLQEYWSIIKDAKDVHRKVPEDRFNLSQCSVSEYNKKTEFNPRGCFMEQPGHFDNSFFNVSPREAAQMDPIQRILLMVTHEALEMAGYSQTTAQKYRIGTFFGQATDDWRESHASQNIDIFYVGGGMRAFGPGRLNYHYKWQGPSYSIDAACSSSLAALEIATKAITAGDCDIAIAGGGNLISALPMFAGLHLGGFTSTTGPCKTFDIDADGYCRGEGVGVVVIKQLQDAIKDNDRIRGVIEGISTNHSALATSITHPHAPTQVELMRATLDSAGLEPYDIDYVEFHGTGTVAGDAAELSSVGEVFGNLSNRNAPILAGAVKANVGHGEAAAGIHSLIKSLLMIEHESIPPHAGIKSKPNSMLLGDCLTGIQIPKELVEFKARDTPRRILINNFNATGGNTSMILGSYNSPPKKEMASLRTHYPIMISAKSSKSLAQNLENLKDFIDANPGCSLADLSYTTTARRLHFPYRKALVADSLSALRTSIEDASKDCSGPPSPKNPPIAYAFSGQGNQAPGVAKQLYEESPEFKKSLDEYDSMCVKLGFPSFLEFILDRESDKDWVPAQLQLGAVAVEMALFNLWLSWGLRPSLVIGHSIGEYPALCVAGVLSLTEMMRLVGERAKLMEKRCEPGSHAMLAVSCPPTEAEKLLKDAAVPDVSISCYNCDEAVSLSGTIESLDAVETRLEESAIKFKRLKTQYAFHSAMLDPILDEFRSITESVFFQKPRIPFASTFHGCIIQEEGIIDSDYLVNQSRQPVNFSGALRASENLDAVSDDTIWIEIGPGNPACLQLIRRLRNISDTTRLIASIDSRVGVWESFVNGLSNCYDRGADPRWDSFHKLEFENLNLLDLPRYAFELNNFWTPSSSLDNSSTMPKHVRLSPLLHYVESTSHSDEGLSAEFWSELNDPVLFGAIEGHEVLGTPLCPSSVYACIALEAASYLYTKMEDSSTESPEYEIQHMDIQKPLIVQSSTKQLLRVSALYNEEQQLFEVKLFSRADKQENLYATSKVKVSQKADWQAEWSEVAFLARARLVSFEESDTQSHMTLQRQILYKLFSSIVNYGKSYQGIKSMILSNTDSEAVADVEFLPVEQKKSAFDWHLMDTIIHTAGFILNNGIENSKDAFISDGWDSFRVLHEMKREQAYKCYVRLIPSADQHTYSGNLYVFCDTEVVASCGGLRFRRMKLESLRKLLTRQSPVKTDTLSATSDHSKTDSTSSSHQKASKSRSSEGNEVRQDESDDVKKMIQNIISEESGLSFEGNSDSFNLQDLGLDSILVSEIASRIVQEIGVDISIKAVSSVVSIKELKDMVIELKNSTVSPKDSTEGPANDSKGSEIDSVKEGSHSIRRDVAIKATSVKTNDSGSKNTADIFEEIIVQEIGVTIKEARKASDLGELGLDSLLATEILDLVGQRTGTTWPASFFKDYPSLDLIRSTLSEKNNGTSDASNPLDTPEDVSPASPNGAATRQKKSSKEQETNTQNSRECKSILLQGQPHSFKPPLILLPPGLGATTVYNSISQNPENTPIYGLASPFLNDPMSNDFTIDNAVAAYVRAIEQICPSGVVHLGGWSLGGVLAYEAARELTESGRQVGALLIIDCPFPDPWPADTPTLTVDALTVLGHDKIMIDRYGSNPQKLKEHVLGIMNAFKKFSAKPMANLKGVAFPCNIVATHGNQVKYMERAIAAQRIIEELGDASEKAVEKLDSDHPELLDYEYEKKDGLESDGWKTLLGHDLAVRTVEADHISIITEAAPLSKLSEYIHEGINNAMKKLRLS